tara:strand:+ start:289 stop:417 length:129 start_codon:yes stop_codon:yes gene_type:complete
MQIACIDCDNLFTLRGGTSGNATKRCGKCYLEWKRETRRNKK